MRLAHPNPKPTPNQAIALAYENKYDKSLAGAIKSEFSSVFEVRVRVRVRDRVRVPNPNPHRLPNP